MAFFAPFQQRYPGVASILRNGALLTATHWTEAGLRGLYALLIARWLGPELYGVWSFATTSYVFAVMLTGFGLETLIPLRLGRDRASGAFLGTTFLLRLGLVVFAALTMALYALTVEGHALSRLALLIALPALIGRGLVHWSRSAFLGLERNHTAFGLAAALRVLEVCAGLVSLWLGAGVFTLLVIHAVSWLAEAALSLPALSRQVAIRLHIDRAELRTVLKQGAVLALAATSVAVLAAMPLILTRYVTDNLKIVGQIGLATQLATLAVMCVQGILAAALPVVGRASAKGDPRLRLYAIGVAFGAVAAFGIAIVAARAFGIPVIDSLLGVEFAPAGALLPLALLVGGMTILPVGFGQILVAQGRRWPGMVAGWSGALILLLALPPMVRASGASGALIAAALGWSVRAVILIGCALVPMSASDR
ncbi:hypothetical protein DDZ14_15850 [Maritimibacter sp. 55A14]|uniref:lipopolysaccharide biosynthesis protein n=1 Tax=Maritimibacter sp. 55A14 TaxID=2174844 RepID=UPI000D6038BB|nr:oligosaccharide flippase family protein [Maritimibacter sp. 55A14]PWE30033.1 hypothetical protein DDZ14_15850 [Maritimibacter sp. 55A14]